MLLRPKSLALAVGVACLSLTAVPGPAPADIYFETSYLPTSTAIGLSPSLLPTSYVVPTSYFPTSYVATSAVLATDSVVYPTTTTYYRRSLFRPRRYVERTYNSYAVAPTSYLLSSSYALPTTYISGPSLLPATYVARSYVSPTSYVIDNDVITTSASSYPCETSPTPNKSTANRNATNGGDSGGTITSSPSSGGMNNERRPQGAVSSTPAYEEAPSSAVNPSNADRIPPVAPTPANKPDASTPPNPQKLEEPKPEDIKLPPAGQSGGSPSGPGEMSYRTSRRPNYETRNILRGRVIAAESRQPEEGVTVIVSHISGKFNDRPAMTDAYGDFKVSLPDGDWVVKVRMPSGSVYPVGNDYVTASNGQVTNSSGRKVADFLITR